MQECLGFMTITTNRKIGALLRRMMHKEGLNLTPQQWGILAHAWNRDRLTQEELAQAACADKTTMSRALRCLEGAGLIARQADPADARRKLLRPTPKAELLKERSAAVVRSVLALALEDVAPEDRATTLRTLAKVQDNLQRYGG